jgi:hypothetical protein
MRRAAGDFPHVCWRVLTELATSETERKKFDAKISAGERVDGAEIVRERLTNAEPPRTRLRSVQRNRPQVRAIILGHIIEDLGRTGA